MEYPDQDLPEAEDNYRERKFPTELEIEAPSIITNKEVGRTEEFKRPSHPDFLDSSELKKMGWSGVRHNQILNHLEIWKCGNLAASMSVTLAMHNPEKWEELYRDAFDLEDVTQVSNQFR